LISITFAGLPISAWQDPKLAYKITQKKTTLHTGETHVGLSPHTTNFPREFLCTTDDFSDIENLAAEIGNFDTLVISGVSYSDCYISKFEDIFEVSRGSGEWTYTIEFSKADKH